jgi:hypothetical protein
VGSSGRRGPFLEFWIIGTAAERDSLFQNSLLIVTPPLSKHLEIQVTPRTGRSTIARIRATWRPFHNSVSCSKNPVPSSTIQPPVSSKTTARWLSPSIIPEDFAKATDFSRVRARLHRAKRSKRWRGTGSTNLLLRAHRERQRMRSRAARTHFPRGSEAENPRLGAARPRVVDAVRVAAVCRPRADFMLKVASP